MSVTQLLQLSRHGQPCFIYPPPLFIDSLFQSILCSQFLVMYHEEIKKLFQSQDSNKVHKLHLFAMSLKHFKNCNSSLPPSLKFAIYGFKK